MIERIGALRRQVGVLGPGEERSVKSDMSWWYVRN